MQIIKPNTNLPFISTAKPFIIFSALLVVAMLVLPFVKSPNWGTSFRGGSTITLHFEDAVDTEEVRNAFNAHPEFSSVSVQSLGGGDKSSFMIKVSNTTTLSCDKVEVLRGEVLGHLQGPLSFKDVEVEAWPTCTGEGLRGDFFVRFSKGVAPEGLVQGDGVDFDPVTGISVAHMAAAVNGAGIESTVEFESESRRFIVKPAGLQADVVNLLSEAFGERFDRVNGLDEIVTVGADVGEKFRNDGIVSILFALGLILLYIAIRFDIRFAPGAVVALAHDVIVTFGLLTLLGMEVTLETVAALLAIVGYSLNDTIVTFDRVRENLTTSGDEPFPTVVNRAINACLSRTLLTSITTLLAVVSLSLLSTGVIADFATTLVFGVLIGTYSSIYIASPALVWMDHQLRKRREREAARKRLEETATAS